ncbi:MAG: ComF family protein [Pseudomonadales bacterium]|nr:ComF family protein [Candidatus Woesebacteria bacterium]MCB9801549.1 ComF family protein [Pseudomonadales bacterium]
MKKYLKDIAGVTLDLLFPPFCCGCKTTGTLLCERCFQHIEFLTSDVELPQTSHLSLIRAVAEYEYPVRQLLFSLKYSHVRAVGTVIGRLMYHCSVIPECDVITSVPMHPKKQDARGYNQAEIIAASIATKAHIPYKTLLTKIKATTAQASIHHRGERADNALGVYAVIEEKKADIAGKRVLVIDDVCTTGATLDECARVLKEAGAGSVSGFVCAHEG